MRREQQKADTRERLLQVGIDLFSRQGYSATGIKAIVDAAGVPKGSFYNYFPGKEQYAAEMIHYYGDRLLQQWTDSMAAGPADDALARLRLAFENMANQYDGSATGTGCLIGSLVPELAQASELCRAALQEGVDTWCELMAEHLRRAQNESTVRADLTAEQLAELLWNLWEGSLLRMKLRHSPEAVLSCVSLTFAVLLRR